VVRVDVIEIAERDGEPLRGDLYRPAGEGPWPCIVMLHGGAFAKGSRASYARWGRFLAANGYAALAADYRLSTRDRTTYPEAIVDAKAAVRRLRRAGEELGIDPERLGAMGGSAGGYLAAMVALTADDPSFVEPDPTIASTSDRVSVVVPMAGLLDLVAGWGWDRVHRPPDDQTLEWFLGGDPESALERWVDASPLALATTERGRGTRWLIAYGTEDDVAPADLHARPMIDALKVAGATVRTVPLVGAPHFWYMEGAVDASNPYAELMGKRLLTFLETWSGWTADG
jgi:acetyl esterase/lipase